MASVKSILTSKTGILRWMFMILLGIACTLLVIAVATDQWYIVVTDADLKYVYGLWGVCTVGKRGNTLGCARQNPSHHSWSIKPENAVMLTIAAVLSIFAFITAIVNMRGVRNPFVIISSIINMTVSVMLNWIGLGFFVAKLSESRDQSHNQSHDDISHVTIGFSLVLSITGCVVVTLLLPLAILLVYKPATLNVKFDEKSLKPKEKNDGSETVRTANHHYVSTQV